MRSRGPFPILLLAGLVAIAAALPACGEGDGSAGERAAGPTQPSREYRELLSGLERAATTGAGYEAIRRADALPAHEEAAIDAFCEIVWKVDVNQDGDVTRGSPLKPWIRSYAESNLGLGYLAGKARLPTLSTALTELDSVIDINGLDGALSKRYKRACYS